MITNLSIMLFPYAHKFYPLCFYFCPLCPHYVLEYLNHITGQENNYSNYLTFIIIIARSRKGVGYGSGSWILGLEWILGMRPVSTRLYVRLSTVAL